MPKHNPDFNKVEYDMKYTKEHQKRLCLSWKKDEYESKIYPAIEKSGMPVNTFIKEAVNEKIERDNL